MTWSTWQLEAIEGIYKHLIDNGLPVRDFLAAVYKVGVDMNDTEFHLCTCGGHAVKVELLDWTQFGGKEKNVILSLWGWVDSGKPSWLQQVWNIIRHGNPYVGDVCLTVDEAQKLGIELIKMSMEEL